MSMFQDKNTTIYHMKICGTCFFILFLSSCFDRKHEQKEIINTWKAYRIAFSNNMGKECSKYIDSESIRYYDYLLTLVRTADSETVERLRLDQQLAILQARHTMPPSQIALLNGKTFFESLVQQDEGGGSNETPSFEFLSLTPTHAEAEILDSNGKRGLKLIFNKENKIWKLNVPYISGQISKSSYEQMIKESGKTEHEFIYTILELANHKKPSNKVWHPL